jgi:hypothetical protein
MSIELLWKQRPVLTQLAKGRKEASVKGTKADGEGGRLTLKRLGESPTWYYAPTFQCLSKLKLLSTYAIKHFPNPIVTKRVSGTPPQPATSQLDLIQLKDPGRPYGD